LHQQSTDKQDIFQTLTANAAKGALFQNIRPVPNNSPVTDLADKNLRCNAGGNSGSGTTTVSVAAGSTVSFTADQAVYHQGPVTFYMTKVDSAAAADGSSDWFKIKEIGPTFSGGQASWDMSATYSTTIPSQIPAGDYLLRIEQLGIHNPGSPPQFYISCAQVKVTGGGSGKPSPTTKIPGKKSCIQTACETLSDFVPRTFRPRQEHRLWLHCEHLQQLQILRCSWTQGRYILGTL
jgi:hypothetical protein